jgi:proteic killer suppression protein
VEKLSGNRAIRVNDQWRICFTWSTAGAGNVELVDYH